MNKELERGVRVSEAKIKIKEILLGSGFCSILVLNKLGNVK